MKTKTYQEQLLAVCNRAIYLLQRKGWTQGALARDSSGEETKPCDEAAICFCALGAIDRAACDVTGKRRTKAGNGVGIRLRKAIMHDKVEMRKWYSITLWNDSPRRTKQEVIAAFKQVQKQIESQ
jgi:hypothetical protein